MREIKFRAWDKQGVRMFEVDGLSFLNQYITDESGQHTFKFNQCYLMQYTGLKDINGKEIYEGDIVRFKDFHDIIVAEVVWHNEGQWDYKPKDWIMGYHAPMVGGNIEVIGNIKENPGLLEKE